MIFSLNVNGKTRKADVDADTPLLWVLRDTLGMTGTKYGCGAAMCGACTVHVDGLAKRACALPVALLKDAQVQTIEGLAASPAGEALCAMLMQAAATQWNVASGDCATVDGAVRSRTQRATATRPWNSSATTWARMGWSAGPGTRARAARRRPGRRKCSVG